MSLHQNEAILEYREDNCLCLNCGEHAVNMEDGVEICDACVGEANCDG